MFKAPSAGFFAAKMFPSIFCLLLLNRDADQDLRRVAGCQGPGFDKELPSQGGMLIRDPSHVVDLKLNSSLSGESVSITPSYCHLDDTHGPNTVFEVNSINSIQISIREFCFKILVNMIF